MAEAIEKSRATCVYIANLMTQPGETAVSRWPIMCAPFEQHTGRKLMDASWSTTRLSLRTLRGAIESKGAEPVLVDPAELRRTGLRCVFDDLLEVHGVVRHDPANGWRACLLERFVEQ